MKKFCLNAPINSVSFGQVSYAILRELLDRGIEPNLFPIGQPDLKAQGVDGEFHEKLNSLLSASLKTHDRKDPCFKIWHLNGALDSPSEEQLLLSFYELDAPTEEELNAAKNNKTLFSCRHSIDVFKEKGVEGGYLPLFFDHLNFERKDRQYFSDDRIVFNLCGKFEKRKHHSRILDAWSRKYGNDNRYSLQCAIYNPFLTPEENDGVIHQALRGVRYSNIQILKPMVKNSLYNDFLNSGNIVIGMSGGEGWGLPEFHSMALGKHAVMLDAHSYKEFAREDNAVLVKPTKKIDAYDGKFFNEGANFNQGQIYTWDEDDFVDGCDQAIKRFNSSQLNEKGLELQDEFSLSKTVDVLLKHIEDM